MRHERSAALRAREISSLTDWVAVTISPRPNRIWTRVAGFAPILSAKSASEAPRDSRMVWPWPRWNVTAVRERSAGGEARLRFGRQVHDECGRAGEDLYVTGSIGAAAAGLGFSEASADGKDAGGLQGIDACVRRHCAPEPRSTRAARARGSRGGFAPARARPSDVRSPLPEPGSP